MVSGSLYHVDKSKNNNHNNHLLIFLIHVVLVLKVNSFTNVLSVLKPPPFHTKFTPEFVSIIHFSIIMI